MLNKAKNNKVHELSMAQLADVKICLKTFEAFMQEACKPDRNTEVLRTLCEEVYEKEHEADITLRKMIDSLTSVSFLPSTREDLISIGTNCDKIANKCEDISYMVVLQNFVFPSDYSADIQEIISLTHKQFKILEESISLLFSKFGELLKEHSILDGIREYESQIDVFERKLYEKSYALDIGLAEKMQLTEFVSSLCDLSDIIENVADKIQIMLVTRKA